MVASCDGCRRSGHGILGCSSGWVVGADSYSNIQLDLALDDDTHLDPSLRVNVGALCRTLPSAPATSRLPIRQGT